MNLKKLLIIIFIFAAFPISAQFHDYNFKYGIQGHFLIPNTEFDNDAYRLSLQGRGFLRTELSSTMEAEIGIGIAMLNGEDYKNEKWESNFIPADIRLVLSPFASEGASPYVYAGFGMLRWFIQTQPSSISPNATAENGWSSMVPLGGGMEFAISDEILLDVSGGYSFTFTDDLNYFNSGDGKDGYFNVGLGLTFVSGGGLTDKDMDGLTKKQEKELGTNPNLADSDNDKISDGDEINKYKTDPLSNDSDKDGLDDYAEIMDYKTDPNSADTDGDELSDYDEIEKYKSNPIAKNSDEDDFSDGYEVNKYKTDPSKTDTDDDGLNDSDEIKKYKTDPLNADSDGDGLKDGQEVSGFNSDPLNKDSDNGGTDDFTEFKRKTNPNDPADDIKEEMILDISAPMVLEGVTFETGKSVITATSEKILLKAYNTMVAYPELLVEIHGYTDNVGNADFNKKLSQKRADAVKDWLVRKGIDGTRIVAKGFGEENPIADNNTAEGKQKNRRIEFIKVSK